VKKARNNEIREGQGSGSSVVPFCTLRYGRPGRYSQSRAQGSFMTDERRIIECLICGTQESLNHKYQLEIDICDPCAERVANLYAYERSGEYMTWEDPGSKARPPSRKSLSFKLRLAVHRRDGFACLKCGCADELTVDHVDPVCNGGTDDLENLQTLCLPCNLRKGSKLEMAA
jgi:hypothetical protein